MSEFTDYLKDVFAEFGVIRVRKMFGGHGLYYDGCMFGLIADDTLYLKVDEHNRHLFEAEDLPPFEYEKKDGKLMAMSYCLAPEVIYEDAQQAREWAVRSWEAAARAKRKSSASKRRASVRAKRKSSASK